MECVTTTVSIVDTLIVTNVITGIALAVLAIAVHKHLKK